ncbi:MAG: hypothetical protein ACLUEK_10370 [Oscillospiraceae bacterium]
MLTAWLVLRLLRCIGASDDARLVALAHRRGALGLIYGFTAGWTLVSAAAGLFSDPALGGGRRLRLRDGGHPRPGLPAGAQARPPGRQRKYGRVRGRVAATTFSAKALAAIVLVNMCADLAKLLLIDLSSNSSVNVNLPYSLLFCLAALIVSASWPRTSGSTTTSLSDGHTGAFGGGLRAG